MTIVSAVQSSAGFGAGLWVDVWLLYFSFWASRGLTLKYTRCVIVNGT